MNKPTCPGFYWLNDPSRAHWDEQTRYIVEVIERNGRLEYFLPRLDYTDPVDQVDKSATWKGPLSYD